MAFRADEAAEAGLEKTKRYLLKSLSPDRQAVSERMLAKIVEDCGPVVESYPTWHPLVSNHADARHPQTVPGKGCGYRGLDHTRYFAHGFITCPYGDGQDTLRSIREIPRHPAATINAERLDVSFYADNATAILVRCEWERPLDGHYVPKALAVPLMMEQELPAWRWAERGETWETMRHYLLGEPHGNRSSHFVNQDTALALKKMYAAMNDSGMYGAVRG